MIIKVKYKTIWGKDRFEPINEDAHFLSKLMNKNTFTKQHLELCRDNGHEVMIAYFEADKYLSLDKENVDKQH